jgi:hypothetical protein
MIIVPQAFATATVTREGDAGRKMKSLYPYTQIGFFRDSGAAHMLAD